MNAGLWIDGIPYIVCDCARFFQLFEVFDGFWQCYCQIIVLSENRQAVTVELIGQVVDLKENIARPITEL